MTMYELAVEVCAKLKGGARKPCPYYSCADDWKPGTPGITLEARQTYQARCRAGSDGCRGRGWLPAILLPEEPCPPVGTGPNGTYRVDEVLLRELLEKAGYEVIYTTRHRWRVYGYPEGSSLLIAAAEALGAGRD